MILYHFSNGKYSKLIPKLEKKKDISEKNVKSKDAIFLTTNPDTIYDHDTGDNFFKYRYTVNIDKDDQQLYTDSKFNKVMKAFDKNFKSGNSVCSCFYYTSSLDYTFISEWDKKLCKFS